MSFHPDENKTVIGEKNLSLTGFIANIKTRDSNKELELHIIDDKALDNFIRFYSDKSINDLEIHEKEEIRCILESMGNYNTIKLKKLLNNNFAQKEQEIYRILYENLFDQQLIILNEMLSR